MKNVKRNLILGIAIIFAASNLFAQTSTTTVVEGNLNIADSTATSDITEGNVFATGSLIVSDTFTPTGYYASHYGDGRPKNTLMLGGTYPSLTSTARNSILMGGSTNNFYSLSNSIISGSPSISSVASSIAFGGGSISGASRVISMGSGSISGGENSMLLGNGTLL